MDHLYHDLAARMKRSTLEQAESSSTTVTETTTVYETVQEVAPYWSCYHATGLVLSAGNDWTDEFEAGSKWAFRKATAGGEIMLAVGFQWAQLPVRNSGSAVNVDCYLTLTGAGLERCQIFVDSFTSALTDEFDASQSLTLTIPSGDSIVHILTNDDVATLSLTGMLFDNSQVTWIQP